MIQNLVVLLFAIFWLPSSAQTTKTPDCKKLKAKGYSQTFCDYDKKYAFKTIPFESDYEFVSKQCF